MRRGHVGSHWIASWPVRLGFVLVLSLGVWTSAQEMPMLQPGTPITLTLTADAPALLQFEGQAGAVVSLSAAAVEGDEAALDTTLAVIAPDGAQIAYDDDTHRISDTGETLIERDAQLPALRLPLDGVYTVRVDSFNGVSEGAVRVSLRVVADPFAQQIETTGDTTRIALTLPAQAVYQRRLSLEAGAQVTITARDTAGTLDPLLRLRDAQGDIVAQNDDHATGDPSLNVLDAQITAWTVPAGGDYTLEVLDFVGAAGTLHLTIATAP